MMAIQTTALQTSNPGAEMFAASRACMVNSQIRPNKVNDSRILTAMRRIPREAFLPVPVVPLAYLDEDIPLGNGRFMMEPMVLARLLQAALLQENERVLVVGAGPGYGAAVLAHCGCRVTALEEEPALIALARAVLPAEAPGVTLVTGPLAGGWPANAPYDVILIEGAVPEIPTALIGQLHGENGRILAVICGEGRTTQAVIGEVSPAGLGTCPIFDCGTPAIPSLRRAPVFEF
ncbi:protein-L-isoaspartate O-methyltransferase family protein [Rhodopila sp.]|uniref:protein-L-isoaspartate O-methyltransferase family protein n=1 Tax=Rhodopila sp. TaxID=2480087 RepID=UPI003D0DE6A3